MPYCTYKPVHIVAFSICHPSPGSSLVSVIPKIRMLQVSGLSHLKLTHMQIRLRVRLINACSDLLLQSSCDQLCYLCHHFLNVFMSTLLRVCVPLRGLRFDFHLWLCEVTSLNYQAASHFMYSTCTCIYACKGYLQYEMKPKLIGNNGIV